jgi:hypothetical protein
MRLDAVEIEQKACSSSGRQARPGIHYAGRECCNAHVAPKQRGLSAVSMCWCTNRLTGLGSLLGLNGALLTHGGKNDDVWNMWSVTEN